MLPVLLGRIYAFDLAEKHGALLAIAELSMAWCSLPDKSADLHLQPHPFKFFVNRGNNITDHLTDDIIHQLVEIVPKVKKFYYECIVTILSAGEVGSIKRSGRGSDETCRYSGCGCRLYSPATPLSSALH